MIYIALTFDDGFVNHLHYARLLKRLGIRATFFITTHPMSDNWISSRPEFIQAIAEMGHEIGSHSKYHVDLTGIPREMIEENLRDSKKFLEDLLGSEVLGFSYPYGSYNFKLIPIVAKYYEYARGVLLYPWEDPLNLVTINKYTLSGMEPNILIIIKRLIMFRKIPVLMNSRKCISASERDIPKIVLVFHDKEFRSFLGILNFLLKQHIRNHVAFVTMKELLENISYK